LLEIFEIFHDFSFSDDADTGSISNGFIERFKFHHFEDVRR
jgi:hypothetical protein